jgi:prepilin-type processing-associated H-X9-DG protein
MVAGTVGGQYWNNGIFLGVENMAGWSFGSPASVIVFAEKINFLPTTPPKQIKTYAGVVGFDNPSANVWTYMYYSEILALLAAGSTADNLTRVDFTRHSGGSNYSFCDGHSKWYRLDQTIPGGPSEDLSTPVKTTDHRLWGEWNYSGSN